MRGRACRESIRQAHARKVLLAGIAGRESGVRGGSLRLVVWLEVTFEPSTSFNSLRDELGES